MRSFSVAFSAAAIADLEAIRDYIAEARYRLRKRVRRAAFRTLRTAPRRGTKRDDIRPGLRLIGWRRTVTIAFAVDEGAERVDVTGIFYRGRDVVAALGRRT